MAQYNIPYNNWEDGDVAYAEQVLANFNAILSAINNGIGADNLAANSVTDVKIGTRTINDATAATDTAQLTAHLSGLANRIKAITGEANWKTAPVKSLKTMNTAVVTAVADSAAAVTTANTANTKADTAVATANTANTNASSALTNSTNAVSTANTASGNATTALTNSATAINTANAADAKANTAITDSATAISTANSADTKANTAISTANTADGKADTAIATANTADGKADTAVSTANTALGQDIVEPYTGALGAMKIATDVQTDYETQKPLILQAVIDAETASLAVADKVSTEQMNSAIITAKNEIINQIDRKEPVATYADLATTYPTPEDGWLVFVRDSRNTYVYNGVAEEWEVKALEVGYADESGTDGIITSEKFLEINDFMESKGVVNGLATLDATGSVPSSQLGNVPTPVLSADNITLDNANFTATDVDGGMTELFTNVSNGKTAIASAITGMGQSATGSDSFTTLATKIADISDDANAAVGDVLATKTFYQGGSKKTGTMTNRGAVNQSLAINGTYTIPAGYHNGSGVVSQSVTTKGAQTFTPGTANQTIAANQYLTGVQTIAGDADLVAGNIKSGVNIFGVAGNVEPDSKYYLIKNGVFQNGQNLNTQEIVNTFYTPGVSGVTPGVAMPTGGGLGVRVGFSGAGMESGQYYKGLFQSTINIPTGYNLLVLDYHYAGTVYQSHGGAIGLTAGTTQASAIMYVWGRYTSSPFFVGFSGVQGMRLMEATSIGVQAQKTVPTGKTSYISIHSGASGSLNTGDASTTGTNVNTKLTIMITAHSIDNQGGKYGYMYISNAYLM